MTTNLIYGDIKCFDKKVNVGTGFFYLTLAFEIMLRKSEISVALQEENEK